MKENACCCPRRRARLAMTAGASSAAIGATSRLPVCGDRSKPVERPFHRRDAAQQRYQSRKHWELSKRYLAVRHRYLSQQCEKLPPAVTPLSIWADQLQNICTAPRHSVHSKCIDASGSSSRSGWCVDASGMAACSALRICECARAYLWTSAMVSASHSVGHHLLIFCRLEGGLLIFVLPVRLESVQAGAMEK